LKDRILFPSSCYLLSDVPLESQYLLELNHSSVYNARYEEQAYWVLALKAA
jgi:hypothetical protein